jgi:hypothetical protein
VRVSSGGRPATTGLPGQHQEIMTPEALSDSLPASSRSEPGTEGYRPPWLAAEFMPRLAPRVLDDRDARTVAAATGTPKPRASEQFSSTYPWTTIGKVFSGDSNDFVWRRAGTGVMVGPNLLLTVSHLMFWDAPFWWIRFHPLWRNGENPTFGGSYVSQVRGIRNVGDVNGYDYIICQLYNPVGNQCGWMGSRSSSNEDFYYQGGWTSVGYPRNFADAQRPAGEFGIGVQDIDNDAPGLEIETHWFALEGWSGGPLFGFFSGGNADPRVVGIESGYEKDFLDPTRTVFAGGGELVNLVKYGWANWQ